MPLVTTGAALPGLYSHITHSVDKDEAEIPPPFKGANQSKPVGLQIQISIFVRHSHQYCLFALLLWPF